MVFNLSETASVALQFLADLRNVTVQKDRMTFRKNLERLGSLMAYEVSRKLAYREAEITTPLGKNKTLVLQNNPVLLTILRAGLPYTDGFLSVFDRSDVGFVGAFREEAEQTVSVKMGYVSIPPVKGKDVIVVDPMLATGSSIVKVIDDVLVSHEPRSVVVASVIAAPEGIKRVKEHLEGKGIEFSIWTWAIDEGLNENFFIVPGLGDAGDLSYGSK